MIKNLTVNTFEDGMIMDLDPLKVPNSSLSSALNATLLTFNSNENSLQCDMGNGRVESAYLPLGYIPLGTTSFGGIIYIVSYNPEDNKCQIGSFPSPERNITQDEVPNNTVTVTNSDFIGENNEIIKTLVKKKLSDIFLTPGDKFIVYANRECSNIAINDSTKWVDARIATVNSSGELIYLDNIKTYGNNYPFKVDENFFTGSSEKSSTNLDTYREMIGADYSIFNTKVSGNLYVIFKLNVLESFDLTYDIIEVIDKTDETDKTYKIELQYSYSPADYLFFDNPKVEWEFKEDGRAEQLSIENNQAELTNGKTYTIKATPVLQFGKLTTLAKTLNINTNLINSGTLLGDIWRYYNTELASTINFSLDIYPLSNLEVEGVQIVFIPPSKLSGLKNEDLDNLYDTEDYYTYKIPSRKSYSGEYTIDISYLDKFIKNTLYLAIIYVKFSDNTVKSIKHWLYTNEMFNSNFEVFSEKNFDELELPLTYLINNETTPLVNTTTSSNSSLIYDTSTAIKSTYQTIVNITVNLDFKISLEKDFDTFVISNPTITVEDKDINITPTISYEEHKNVVLANTPLEIPAIDEASSSINNNIFTGKYTINDCLTASTAEKDISILNYYSPIASTEEEYLQYGIYLDGTSWKNLPSFVGLGMSSGGRDNEGGGGVFHAKGAIDLATKEVDVKGSKVKKIYQVYAEARDETENMSGYSKFPKNDLSTLLSDLTGSLSIVPVLLTWVGGNTIKLENGTEWRYTDRERGTPSRKQGFESEQESTTRKLWWFMKTNSSTNTYVPLNNYNTITVSNIESSLGYLPSLLSLLYVKKYRETPYTVKKYTVDKFNYHDNILLKISFKLSNLTLTIDLQVDSTSLSTMQSKHTAKCVTIPNLLELFTSIAIQTPINNILYEDFFKASTNTAFIDTYVNCIYTDSQLLAISDTKANILIPNFEEKQLEPLTSSSDIKRYKIVTRGNTPADSCILEEIPSLSSGDITVPNPEILYYNNRTNELLINYTEYTKLPLTVLKFLSGDNNYVSNTYISKASIFDINKIYE